MAISPAGWIMRFHNDTGALEESLVALEIAGPLYDMETDEVRDVHVILSIANEGADQLAKNIAKVLEIGPPKAPPLQPPAVN